MTPPFDRCLYERTRLCETGQEVDMMNVIRFSDIQDKTQTNDEILCNRFCSVNEDGVICVDRSQEEDTSDLPKNVYRVRSGR